LCVANNSEISLQPAYSTQIPPLVDGCVSNALEDYVRHNPVFSTVPTAHNIPFGGPFQPFFGHEERTVANVMPNGKSQFKVQTFLH
jgi:hypothetical protein